MKANTKVQASVKTTSKNAPIVAWAVEEDGDIRGSSIFKNRASARADRRDACSFGVEKAHVRKVMIHVIPGR